MNKKFQKINIEDVLFFDSEIVRANKELIKGSKEYELFKKKVRDRETDATLPHLLLSLEYEQKAALKRCYNKIVTIGVGFVKDGVAYIKDISGEEEDVIREFVSIANMFKYICGFNSIAFDLPMIVGNGMKYFNIANELNDNFNPSGKKPWQLENCICLLETFKGTHYYASSLDELCYHFNIPTPKDDIDGAEVSDVYYNGDRQRIYDYVKKDVFANINIFQKMQGKPIFETFIDRNQQQPQEEKELLQDNRNVLQQLYDTNELTQPIKEKIAKRAKKLGKRDKDNLFKILRAVYVRNDFVNQDQDTKKVIKEKEEEIKEFIEEL